MTPLITRDPGIDFPPIPVKETLRSVRSENCTGLSALVEVPAAFFDGHYPAGDFELAGTGTPMMAPLVIDAAYCKRVVISEHIIEDHATLRTFAWVQGKNSSWEPTSGPSFYYLDNFVSSQISVDALAAWGIPANLATFEFGALPAPNVASGTWTVTAGTTTIFFEFFKSANMASPRNATNYYWVGEGDYLRSTVQVDWVSSLNEYQVGGVVKFSGPSQAADVNKFPVAYWQGEVIVSENESVVLDPEVFLGSGGT
jgi:hypothetical protein